MLRISSELRGAGDRAVFAHLQLAAEQYADIGYPLSNDGDYARKVATEYVRMGRRRRWSWKLIGECLGISPKRAARLFREWQAATFPET